MNGIREKHHNSYTWCADCPDGCATMRPLPAGTNGVLP